MGIKMRFPEPTNVKDEDLRRYLNELIRSLNTVLETVVIEDDLFGFVSDYVVAGTGINVTADTTAETITIATSA